MMGHGSPPIDVEDEYEKLVLRMNPPRVTVDNTTSFVATLVKEGSANKHGSLLEVVQVLNELNLTIKRAYISSDGGWFMDDHYSSLYLYSFISCSYKSVIFLFFLLAVFHVVDQDGNKLCDGEVIDRIQRELDLSMDLSVASVAVEE